MSESKKFNPETDLDFIILQDIRLQQPNQTPVSASPSTALASSPDPAAAYHSMELKLDEVAPPTAPPQIKKAPRVFIFFDYLVADFQPFVQQENANLSSLGHQVIILQDVHQLTHQLKQHSESILLLNLGAPQAAKAALQLAPQLKQKFPKVQLVFCFQTHQRETATGLLQQHQVSHLLFFPLSRDQLLNLFN